MNLFIMHEEGAKQEIKNTVSPPKKTKQNKLKNPNKKKSENIFTKCQLSAKSNCAHKTFLLFILKMIL